LCPYKIIKRAGNSVISRSEATRQSQLVTCNLQPFSTKEKIHVQMLNSTNNIKIATNFKLSEFACPCCMLVMLHPKLLAKLVEIRNIIERPVYITSGYRCPRYNQKIGGVPNSYHRIGLAADIKVGDISLIELLEVCENIDFTGIGFYEKKRFLHLDVRPTKRTRWRE